MNPSDAAFLLGLVAVIAFTVYGILAAFVSLVKR